MTKAPYVVVVRYDSENPLNRHLADVFYHKTPKAAARRLTALINRKAKWVPKRVAVGTRFYIIDHSMPGDPTEHALLGFKKRYRL